MKRSAIILALLVLSSACREKTDPRPAALKQELATMRAAIQRFHSNEGRYPTKLEELVPKYLPAIPNDPVTNAKSWRLVTEESVQPSSDFQTSGSQGSSSVIIDVQSGAPGADPGGVPYANY